jgi:heat shock protein HtpX
MKPFPVDQEPLFPTFLGTLILGLVGVFLIWLGWAVLQFIIASATAGPFGMMFGMGSLAVTITTGLVIGIPVAALVLVFAAITGTNKDYRPILIDHSAKVLETDDPTAQRVHRLAEKLGLAEMPAVAVYPSKDLNAFAAGAGSSGSVVALSDRLLSTLPDDQLDAVIAHELGHIANKDIVRLHMVASMQSALAWAFIFYSVRQFVRHTFLLLSEMVVKGVSRGREYRADAIAARLVGAAPMMNALITLRDDPGAEEPSQKRFTMFKIHTKAQTWLATHPPINDRIAALQRMTNVLEGRRAA